MGADKTTRVLVVGSHQHPLATDTINWGEEFYIGEYDAVIFSLPDLTPFELNAILTKNPGYFLTIKKHILDLQIKSGFPIYCVMEKMIGNSPYDIDFNGTNYGWSPIIPILEEVPGKEMVKESSTLPEKYFKLLKGWIGFLDSYKNNTGYPEKDDQRSKRVKVRYRTSSLLKNRAGKDLGFETTWVLQEEHYTGYIDIILESKSTIIFLPKTEDVHEGIDVLLEALVKKPIDEETPPAWVERSDLFGEEQLLKEIGEATVTVKEAEAVITTRTQDLRNLRVYKKLLYTQGDELHEIVEQAFQFLGVEVKRAEVANLEDLIYEEGDQQIPMEVRGKDNSALSMGDVRQVLSRQGEETGKEKYTARGVFILNHYRLTDPAARPKPFETNIVKDLAIPWNICLVTTTTLYDLVDAKLRGEDVSGFKDEFLNTVGVYSYTKPASESRTGETVGA